MEVENMVERQLSFATTSPGGELGMGCVKKPKPDPVSTRILEKRRRDRMNNCLADLNSLIPASYLKEGKGRIEKVDVIEMAIRHIKDLTSIINHAQEGLASSLPDRYLGFKECQDEVMRFLVEVENWDAHDKLCNRMMKHLEQAGEKFRIMNDALLSQEKKEEIYQSVDMSSASLRSKDANHEDEGLDIQMGFYANEYKIPTKISPQSLSTSKKRDFVPLASKCNSTFIIEDSGLSTDPGSSISNTTDASPKFFKNGDDLFGPILEPLPTLNKSSSPTSTETGSDNGNDLYKFKRRFTKRFSEEVTHGINNLSDSSSISSKECHLPCDTMKRKFRDVYSRSPCSTASSNSPQSGSSNNNSSTNGEFNSSSDGEMKSSCYLPGFVLHPLGSYYMPLSIHSSYVSYEILTKASQQESVGNHPIRILVNFGGPLIHMRNAVVDKKSVGCSDNGSPFSCSSENSGNPASEVVTNSP